MKKLIIILATVMVVATGCLMAQNHRHTDRGNVAAVESIASSNAAALDTISETDVDGEFGAFVDTNTDFGHHRGDDDDSIAKIAVVALFGTLSLLFLAPVFIVLVVLYFRHKNNAMKNKIAMAAIEKGVPVPDDQSIQNMKNEYSTQVKTEKSAEAPKSKMEKAIRKVALGAGFWIGGWFLGVKVLIAIGIAFVVYGIGLICIDQFVDKR